MNVLINSMRGAFAQYTHISNYRIAHFKYLSVLSIIPQKSWGQWGRIASKKWIKYVKQNRTNKNVK